MDKKKGPTPPLVRAPADGRRVYLTFDDGPDARWTPRVLDILAANNIRATFFIVGRAARRDAGIVRQVAESHGGDVVAEQAEGGGTRMVLTLGASRALASSS